MLTLHYQDSNIAPMWSNLAIGRFSQVMCGYLFEGITMKIDGPKLHLRFEISQPTLAALWTYFDMFGHGDFQVEVSDASVAMRFVEPRDRALLRREFPYLLEPRSRLDVVSRAGSAERQV